MKKQTFFLKEKDCQTPSWYLVDAKDKILGRLSTRIARILQGKHKPTFTPHLLCGDVVVVINSKHVKVTGSKIKEKIYQKYTGYPSGLRFKTYEELMIKSPTKALRTAVKGMLPKSKLGKRMLRNLKLYPEDKHPHIAQGPVKMEL